MIIENLLAIAIGLVGIAILLFLGFKVFRLLIGYEIADDRIKVLLFHYIPIYKIPFTNIEKIYPQRFHEVVIVPGWHFPSRIFGRRVTIELKNSWFLFAFLTPKDPEGFIREVKNKMSQNIKEH